MQQPDEVFERFGDLLKEIPEAEGPLRDYVGRKAAEERDRKAEEEFRAYRQEQSRQAALRELRRTGMAPMEAFRRQQKGGERD